NHTDMSNTRVLVSINKVGDLIDYAHKIGLLGVAITDHEILGNHVRAQKHLAKRKKENPDDESWQNFKLILGNEIYLCRNDLSESNFVKGEDRFYHFILLALDETGHKQLRELSTRAFKHSWFRNMRRVPTYYRDIEEVIGANPGHVWASSACIGGYLPKCLLQDDLVGLDQADKFIDWCMSTFDGNFSLELQPSNEKDQIFVNNELVKIANRRKLPYIITTDAHYLKKEDRKIHKAFLNSRNAEREVDSFYSTTYLMDENEIHSYMDKTFKINGEEIVNKGFETTCIIARKVKDYSLLKDTKLPYLPLEILEPTDYMKDFAVNNGMFNLFKFMKSEEQSDRQLAYKIADYCIKNKSIANLSRIEEELKYIMTSDEAMNQKWSKYLLQVSDYVKLYWAEGDSLVGPGRGSGVSFYINYILGITQIDPTREKAPMFPWRFLNPERASVLDIDIDIQGNRRNKCIRALKNQYGEFRAVEVVTFGTEKAKSAIKTACLAPNTLINTTNGLKPIEDINSQDKVYSIYGEEQVITPTQRDYTGELYN
ncbi:MAG: PHP domain-containing protein, partial [Crenarchaeota archaeon]|nr:PHP domain-containing protein [Thermoproteota archaeon]